MADLLDLTKALVDERVGIVRRVYEFRKEAGSPDLVYFVAETCAMNALNPAHNQDSIWTCGVATDRATAMTKALGEAVERYCAAIYNSDEFPLSSYATSSLSCIQPENFALFNASQYNDDGFPFVPFDRTSLVRWAPALDLYARETRYVPAQMVFLPYIPKEGTREQPIAPQISTGLACHISPTMAALSGIYEVIERDAFAITWQAQLPRPRIRSDTLPPKLRHLLARIERPGSRVVLLHLPMDHSVPVILSAMTSTVSDAPALVVGAAAHLDPALAIQKSLEELAQIAAMAQRTKSRQPQFSPGPRWKNVLDPQSHAALYYDHANAHLAGFLFDASEYRSFTDIKGLSTGNPIRDLDLLVTTLHSLHYTVVVADVTSEDVRALGLWVLRAIIPGFHPLYMGYRFRALGGMRLREVPRTLGYAGIIHTAGDNPSPHPFS